MAMQQHGGRAKPVVSADRHEAAPSSDPAMRQTAASKELARQATDLDAFS